jgi:hypothetical protein
VRARHEARYEVECGRSDGSVVPDVARNGKEQVMRGTAAGFTAAVAAVLVLGISAWSRVEAAVRAPASAEEKGIGVPATPEEHAARATLYREKAASYRKEAETHRKMFADYKAQQGPPALQTKTGQELPWVAKMRKHCESYMKQAERMAAEADSFAEFHRMRAEEMKGK